MAQKRAAEMQQYNTEMYMARLTLKNYGVHFCTLLICIYTICRSVFSIASIAGGGNVFIALVSVAGLVLISAGSVCALFFSRDGGDRYTLVLTLSVIGAALLLAAGVMEVIFLKVDAETLLQAGFLLSAVITASSLLSAAKGTSANTAGAYLLGITGIATLIFSAIALLSVASSLRACFASTYEWGFFSTDDVDVNSGEIKWYFAQSNVASSTVKTVFFSRFIERMSFLSVLISVSATALKLAPYINQQKRTVEFAQDAGGFSAFDGGDFRSISKRLAEESVKNQSYYGIGSLEGGADYNAPRNDAPGYKTNEYGDYLDEETGIFYYYDSYTGQYYYLDERSGQYLYKQEFRRNTSLPDSDAMPWELEDPSDDEDNIYNY